MGSVYLRCEKKRYGMFDFDAIQVNDTDENKHGVVLIRVCVMSAWDLVCGDQWYQALSMSSFMVGLLFGGFVFGILSDKFGRKVVFIASVVSVHVIGLIHVFSQNIAMFIFLRTCSGFVGIGLRLPFTAVGMALFSTNLRPVVGLLLPIFWEFGYRYMILTGITYVVRTWWILQLVRTDRRR